MDDLVQQTARIIWGRYVGLPAEGAYRDEYEFLIDTLRRLERSAWTIGLKTGQQDSANAQTKITA